MTRTPRGYQVGSVAAGDGPVVREIHPAAVVSGPVPLTGLVTPQLRPALVVIIGNRLDAQAPPGAAERAVGAAFVAAEITDGTAGSGTFVLGECAVELPLDGPVTVLQGTAAGDTYLPEAFGDVVARLRQAADAVGGLRPGQLVVAGPVPTRPGRPLTAGTAQLWGPGGATVIVRVLGPEGGSS